MRRAATATLLLAALAMGTPRVSAQEKPRSGDAATEALQTETTPLKISVTFTEFEGDKKVKSLPYTTIVTADGKNPKSVVKMRSRVPGCHPGLASVCQTKWGFDLAPSREPSR